MELLLQCYALVLTKKVPNDIGLTKIETLHNKVRLLAPVQREPKLEAAVVRLSNPVNHATNLKQASSANVLSEMDPTAYALSGRN